jgi:hypothetical protein
MPGGGVRAVVGEGGDLDVRVAGDADALHISQKVNQLHAWRF